MHMLKLDVVSTMELELLVIAKVQKFGFVVQMFWE